MKARAETPWDVKIGVFKDYLREERRQLIPECFQFDWINMKQPRLKKSEEKDIKKEMERVYPILKENYRIQAG
jgi:hypothetical protein